MKTVLLREILATKGLHLDLTAKEDWILDVFKTVLPDVSVDSESIKGQMDLKKVNDIVDITADLEFNLHPMCARCGNELSHHQKLHIHTTQAPFDEKSSKKKGSEDDDIELNSDDLNFSFYRNDEIELSQILNDEIALNLPYNFYCPDESNCKLEVNAGDHITFEDNVDPRWAPLKNLKNLKN